MTICPTWHLNAYDFLLRPNYYYHRQQLLFLCDNPPATANIPKKSRAPQRTDDQRQWRGCRSHNVHDCDSRCHTMSFFGGIGQENRREHALKTTHRSLNVFIILCAGVASGGRFLRRFCTLNVVHMLWCLRLAEEIYEGPGREQLECRLTWVTANSVKKKT